MKSCIWKAYLPISPYKGRISAADAKWFADRGISKPQLRGALAVLRHVIEDLFCVTDNFPNDRFRFHFLIHDRKSGVPASKKDNRGYLDLTLRAFEEFDARQMLSKKWKFVKPQPLAAVPQQILERQSELYLCIINSIGSRSNDSLSTINLLKEIGQHLHYFANMSQLRVA